MTALEQWLTRATRCLSAESRTTVRAEIQDHYEAGRDEAISRGASSHQAGTIALRALGDPVRANRLYRRALLTKDEARLLKEGKWEARVVHSSRLVRWTMLALPVSVFLAGLVAFFMNTRPIPAVLVGISLVLSVLLHGPFLPIYTSTRSRIYRICKWIVLIAFFAAMVPMARSEAWVLLGSFWLAAWVERIRYSIRRKIPITQWLRHLYL